ncbi:MAG: acyl-CoA dehydrogenase family protein, partial [Actinomycetes bacterium]
MDLSPTTEQETFRSEIRAWLVENLPWKYGQGLPPRFETLDEEVMFLRQWQASLAQGGWVGVAWPSQFGGRGAGPAEHFIV